MRRRLWRAWRVETRSKARRLIDSPHRGAFDRAGRKAQRIGRVAHRLGRCALTTKPRKTEVAPLGHSTQAAGSLFERPMACLLADSPASAPSATDGGYSARSSSAGFSLGRLQGGRAANQMRLSHPARNPLPLVAGILAEEREIRGSWHRSITDRSIAGCAPGSRAGRGWCSRDK